MVWNCACPEKGTEVVMIFSYSAGAGEDCVFVLIVMGIVFLLSSLSQFLDSDCLIVMGSYMALLRITKAVDFVLRNTSEDTFCQQSQGFYR